MATTGDICGKCLQKVINPIFCTGCRAPYHPSCGMQINKNNDGSFSKCCKPRLRNQVHSSTSDVLLKAIENLKIFMSTRLDGIDAKLGSRITRLEFLILRLELMFLMTELLKLRVSYNLMITLILIKSSI